jgi:ankyrin repeat protein
VGVLQALLSAGCQVDIDDLAGRTPLHAAAANWCVVIRDGLCHVR